jgi:hypothetical protein
MGFWHFVRSVIFSAGKDAWDFTTTMHLVVWLIGGVVLLALGIHVEDKTIIPYVALAILVALWVYALVHAHGVPASSRGITEWSRWIESILGRAMVDA